MIPVVSAIGLPAFDDDGDEFAQRLQDAAMGAVESIPRARRKDTDSVREAIRRSVRAAANEVWGKKPCCHGLRHQGLTFL